MGDPHNPSRYGEVWPQHRINGYEVAIHRLRDYVLFSGGWAWHLMSPPGHKEFKHAHDHKDVDIMVPKRSRAFVLTLLRDLCLEKVRTRFDHLPSEEEFSRFEKVVDDGTNPPFRLTFDVFIRDIEGLCLPNGFMVVRPDLLLQMYSTIHSSKSCWAVQAASKLLKSGLKPEQLIGHTALMEP